MRFGSYLSSLTKPELEEIENVCNFSEEEGIIFYMLSKNKSLTEISMKNQISLSTLKRRIISIKEKVGKCDDCKSYKEWKRNQGNG